MTAFINAGSPDRMGQRWEIEYLKHVEQSTGESLSAIARKAEISPTTLTRPVNRPDHKFTVKLATLEAVERATGIPLAPFREGNFVERIDLDDEPRNGSRLIPVYDVQASAGHGTLVEYEAIAYSLAFPPNYLRKLTSASPENLAIISVKGDSMEPTLLDDDVVMIDTSKVSLGYDGLFVLDFDGVLHVKRIGRGEKPGHVRIISDNKAFGDLERAIADIKAVGKVLWYGRKV